MWWWLLIANELGKSAGDGKPPTPTSLTENIIGLGLIFIGFIGFIGWKIFRKFNPSEADERFNIETKKTYSSKEERLFIETMIAIKKRCERKFPFATELKIKKHYIFAGGGCIGFYHTVFDLVRIEKKEWFKIERHKLFSLVWHIYNGQTLICSCLTPSIIKICEEEMEELRKKLKMDKVKFLKE